MKMNDSVNQCLDLLATLRPMTSKTIEDDATNCALKQATTEVIKLADCLVEVHVTSEAAPWLECQNETLRTSQILSKPPGFSILKLKTEFKTVLHHEL